MLRRSVFALSLATLLATSGAALAQTAPTPAPAQPGQPHQRGMERFKQRLGLSDEQATQIQAAYQRHRDAQRQTWQALRAANNELRQLALNGGDPAAIQAKTAEVQKLTADSLTQRVQVLQEIGPILTPEQRAKFAQAPQGRWHPKRGAAQS